MRFTHDILALVGRLMIGANIPIRSEIHHKFGKLNDLGGWPHIFISYTL